MKKMNKMMSATLATLMVGSAMMASAGAVVQVVPEGLKLGVDKNLVLEGSNAQNPTDSFSFVMTPSKDVAEGDKFQKVDEYNGVGDELTASVEYDKESGKKSTTIDLSELTFEKPGAYKYVVTEEAGSTPGMEYDETEYVVHVIVGYDNEGNLTAQSVVSYDADGEKVPVEFENTLTTKSLEITKDVEGTMGDRNKDFEFTVLIDDCDLYEDGTELVGTLTKDGEATEVSVVVGTAYTFEMGHGDSFVVDGLAVDQAYTVTEADYSEDGYTTTMNEDETNEVAGTISADEENVVKVVNTNGNTVDTGVKMDIAPYAIAGAVAVAGAAYLVSKKKHSED